MKKVILIIGAVCFSCFNAKKNTSVEDDKRIIGRWCSLSNTADYPHLTFKNDGLVIFDCKIDTFFSLKYSIANQFLQLTSTDKSIAKNKILKFTRDSLIFETLLKVEQKQTYYRCN
jgi:hypothetical protein